MIQNVAAYPTGIRATNRERGIERKVGITVASAVVGDLVASGADGELVVVEDDIQDAG